MPCLALVRTASLASRPMMVSICSRMRSGSAAGRSILLMTGNDFEIVMQRQVRVGERLRFDALGRIHHQQRALAGLQAARDLVRKVDVAGRVDQIELIEVAVVGRIVQAHGVGLDGDAALALEVHRVEHLLHHFALRQGAGDFEQAVRQRRFAVVDMRNDREIADEFAVHASWGAFYPVSHRAPAAGWKARDRCAYGPPFDRRQGCQDEDRPNLKIGCYMAEFTNESARQPSELIQQVYSQLRRLAARYLASERAGQTIQATDLVHEAYMRLQAQAGARFEKPHFMALAAISMRRILVDRARAKVAVRRGGGMQKVTLEEGLIVSSRSPEDVLIVHEALKKLAENLAPAEPCGRNAVLRGLVVRRNRGGRRSRGAHVETRLGSRSRVARAGVPAARASA